MMTSFVVAATSPENGTSNFWRWVRKTVTGLSRPAHFPQEQASATIARFRSTPCCQPVIQYGGGNMRVRFAYGNASKRDKRCVASPLCRSGVLMPPCSTFRLVHPCRKPGDSVTSQPPQTCGFRESAERNGTPGSPSREPRERGSGSKKTVSLSLRFGLPSIGLFCWPSFDGELSGTELREARGASRGNTLLGSQNAVSLSVRFGLQSTGFSPWCGSSRGI